MEARLHPACRAWPSPVGFALFEVSAMNWARVAGELSGEELAAAGAVLGHPVTQILAHY